MGQMPRIEKSMGQMRGMELVPVVTVQNCKGEKTTYCIDKEKYLKGGYQEFPAGIKLHSGDRFVTHDSTLSRFSDVFYVADAINIKRLHPPAMPNLHNPLTNAFPALGTTFIDRPITTSPEKTLHGTKGKIQIMKETSKDRTTVSSIEVGDIVKFPLPPHHSDEGFMTAMCTQIFTSFDGKKIWQIGVNYVSDPDFKVTIIHKAVDLGEFNE